MRRMLKTYMPFMRASIQEAVEYKFDILTYGFGMSMMTFVLYYLWNAIYAASGNGMIQGFTMTDMTVYIILNNFMMLFMDTDTIWFVAREVIDGSIAMNLIKPVNYHVRVFFRQLGESAVKAMMLLLPTIIGLLTYRFLKEGISVSPVMLIQFTLSVILGYLVVFLFDFMLALTAFYTMNVWGVGMTKGALIRLLNGALIPLVFFPAWAQKLFEFMPFKSMIYTPVMIFLNKFDQSILVSMGMQLVWIGLLVFANMAIWKHATKRLTVQGG